MELSFKKDTPQDRINEFEKKLAESRKYNFKYDPLGACKSIQIGYIEIVPSEEGATLDCVSICQALLDNDLTVGNGNKKSWPIVLKELGLEKIYAEQQRRYSSPPLVGNCDLYLNIF